MLPTEPLLISGSSHPKLAQLIADDLGIRLTPVALEKFPDGEISVQLLESVRGKDVFAVQSVALKPNEYILELLILIDALKRASAKQIAAVIPYFGYARQDRKDRPRVPITAKLIADLLVTAGATRVLTMDLHAGQIQGFFDIPVDNLFGRLPLVEAVKKENYGNLIVAAPDVGSVKIARAFAKSLGVDFAIVDKHRASPTQIETVTVIGDVKGKNVLLADDMSSTLGTLNSAAKACQEKGANHIFAVITHGLFVGDSVQKLEDSPIEMLFMSNTIPETERLKECKKIQIVSVAHLFAEAIRCILTAESIESLYE